MKEEALNKAQLALRDYVIGQARLGYKTYECDPSDVFLVAYSKSGSTWSAYNLFQLKSNGRILDDNLKKEVIDITPGHWVPTVNPFEIPQRFSPRTYKYHGMYDWVPKGGKYIYIARNPVDVLYSFYVFLHHLFGFCPDSEEAAPLEWFYEEFFVKRFNTGHNIGNPWQHFLSWYPQTKNDNVLWIHYEELISNPRLCLDQMRKFMGIEMTDEVFDGVVQRSSMSFCKSLPKEFYADDTEDYLKLGKSFSENTRCYGATFNIARKGVAGDGARNLPLEIRQDMEEKWKTLITPVLGYKNYEEMCIDNSLTLRKEGNNKLPTE